MAPEFLSAEVLLVYLLKYFPIGVGVPLREVDRFCESIKKQIFSLNKGYSIYAESDKGSLYSVIRNHPSRYESFMDQYRLRRRVDVEWVNSSIPKEIQEILENTAKQWARKFGF